MAAVKNTDSSDFQGRVRTARGRPADVVTSILADIDDHVGTDAGQSDDITIAVMSVGTKRARRRTDTLPGVNPDDLFEGPTHTGQKPSL